MTKLCVCKICTCGQHKCPHRPLGIVGKGGPCVISEYKNEYPAHRQEKREAIRPDNDYKPSGFKMEGVTTNKNDYIKHPLNRIPFKQPDVYRSPEGEMDTMTSYAKEYQNKGGRPAIAIKRDNVRGTQAQFDGNTTNKDDYRVWDLTRTKPIRKDDGYTPSSEKFGGASTYGGDFHKHSQAPRTPIRPDNNAIRSNEPFADKTSNRQDYVKFEMQPVYKKPKDPFVQNMIPMDNLTTNRRDYTAKEVDQLKSFKPDGQGYKSDVPFDDCTTNKNDYKKWGPQPMFVRKEQTYMAPQGSMDMKTNYNNDFTAKPNQRPQAVKPMQRSVVNAKFDGHSTYGEDFRKWGGELRVPAKAPASYNPSNIPFDGASTYKNHYAGDKGAAAPSFKPDGVAYRSTEPFMANSSYRSEYIKKELEKCPTTLLHTDKSSFTYVTQDETGHKFYTPNNNQNPVYGQ